MQFLVYKVLLVLLTLCTCITQLHFVTQLCRSAEDTSYTVGFLFILKSQNWLENPDCDLSLVDLSIVHTLLINRIQTPTHGSWPFVVPESSQSQIVYLLSDWLTEHNAHKVPVHCYLTLLCNSMHTTFIISLQKFQIEAAISVWFLWDTLYHWYFMSL